MNSETQAGTPPRIPIETVLEIFPETAAEEWSQHENGGGWKHRDAGVASQCFVTNALLRRGVFRGGEYTGGRFMGGVYLGGMFICGDFQGGVFSGGEFRGAELVVEEWPFALGVGEGGG